jgi:phosphohistidine phosphatase SixA
MPPKTILLMRHGEKPDDEADHHLTEAGRARAARLAVYIPTHFGKPDFIFAASGKHSLRPTETMEPLRAATGAEFNSNYDAEDFKSLAEELLRGVKYVDKLAVVCWRHTVILDFAKALRADHSDYLKKWPSDMFDTILALNYTDRDKPTVLQVVEPF